MRQFDRSSRATLVNKCPGGSLLHALANDQAGYWGGPHVRERVSLHADAVLCSWVPIPASLELCIDVSRRSMLQTQGSVDVSQLHSATEISGTGTQRGLVLMTSPDDSVMPAPSLTSAPSALSTATRQGI